MVLTISNKGWVVIPCAGYILYPSSFWNLEMTTAKDTVTDYTQSCSLDNITALPFQLSCQCVKIVTFVSY